MTHYLFLTIVLLVLLVLLTICFWCLFLPYVYRELLKPALIQPEFSYLTVRLDSTTTRTDFCCFHLQLNQHLAAFLQHHKHKERIASVGIYRQRLRSHVSNSCSTHKERTASVGIYGQRLPDRGYVVTCLWLTCSTT